MAPSASAVAWPRMAPWADAASAPRRHGRYSDGVESGPASSLDVAQGAVGVGGRLVTAAMTTGGQDESSCGAACAGSERCHAAPPGRRGSADAAGFPLPDAACLACLADCRARHHPTVGMRHAARLLRSVQQTLRALQPGNIEDAWCSYPTLQGLLAELLFDGDEDGVEDDALCAWACQFGFHGAQRMLAECGSHKATKDYPDWRASWGASCVDAAG